MTQSLQHRNFTTRCRKVTGKTLRHDGAKFERGVYGFLRRCGDTSGGTCPCALCPGFFCGTGFRKKAGKNTGADKGSSYPAGADQTSVAADPGGAGKRKAGTGHNETTKNKRERIREPDSRNLGRLWKDGRSFFCPCRSAGTESGFQVAYGIF